MRKRGKCIVLLISLFLFIIYNTLLKLLVFHPLEPSIPSSPFRLRHGSARSDSQNREKIDLFIRKKCRIDQLSLCLQYIHNQSWIGVEIPIERKLPLFSERGKLSEHDYVYEGENASQTQFRGKFEVEFPTPKDFVEIPKINPKKVKSKKKYSEYLIPKNNSNSPQLLLERAQKLNNSELSKFLVAQMLRKSSEEKYCSKNFSNDSKSAQQNQSGFEHIIVDREFLLSFCPIYKAASTTWLANLLKLKGMWKSNNNNNKKMQLLVDQVYQKVSNLVAPWISKGTTRFLIVRHPFHRLISCYRDKFEDASKLYYYERYGETMVRIFRPRPKDVNKDEVLLMMNAVRKVLNSRSVLPLPGNPYANPFGPTFEEFVKYIVATKYDDDHWRPYYLQCSLCYMNYDFVLRFENIGSDSKLFVEYLNKSRIMNTGWENPTAEGRTTEDIVCKYLNKISTNLYSKLVQKYQHDFNLFNYSPDEFSKCVSDYRPLFSSN